MWLKQNNTHDWEWLIAPIYGDLGDGLLYIVLTALIVLNHSKTLFEVQQHLDTWM